MFAPPRTQQCTAYSAPPDPLAGFGDGGERKGREGKEGGMGEKERVGKGRIPQAKILQAKALHKFSRIFPHLFL